MPARLALALSALLLCLPAYANLRQAPEPELRDLLQRTVAEADSFADRFDAEVWLLDMSTRLTRYIPDPQERLTLLRLVHREASKAGLRPDLVLALIHTESHFNRFAISSVGAQGMMQVMPFWKAELGRPQDNLTDNATNLRYGCTILSFYLRKENAISAAPWPATTAAWANRPTRPRLSASGMTFGTSNPDVSMAC